MLAYRCVSASGGSAPSLIWYSPNPGTPSPGRQSNKPWPQSHVKALESCTPRVENGTGVLWNSRDSWVGWASVSIECYGFST